VCIISELLLDEALKNSVEELGKKVEELSIAVSRSTSKAG